MSMFGVFGSLLAGLYFVVLIAAAVLVIWVLILLIIFLKLRIAELRGAKGSTSQTAE